jgi:hypothetical protein
VVLNSHPTQQRKETEMPTATRRRRTTKPVAPVEAEELDDEIEELDEEPEPAPAPKRRGRPARKAEPVEEVDDEDDEDEEAPAPRRKTAAKAAAAETFGTTWLVEYVNDQLDTAFDGKALRVKLRQMSEAGLLDRDDNSRYTFTGPNDRKVAKILKFIRDSEKEAPAEKPARKTTAKRTAAAPAKKTTSRRRKAVEPDPDLPDFDEDDEELEDL